MKLLSYSKAAWKALAKLREVDRVAMIEKLDCFAETGTGDVKKLKGATFFRLRHGDYRAVISIEPDRIIVDHIEHRRDVYRKL